MAVAMGDPTGRIANVILMGILSTLSPFDRFPVELWWKALQKVNAKPAVWAANFAAFNTLTVVDNRALTLAGAVGATNTGTVDIGTLTGGLTQASTGTLTTGTLTSTGSIAGAAVLLGTANAIGTIANFAAANTLTVVNGRDLTLTGRIATGTSAVGTVDIRTIGGGLTQASTGTLTTGTLTSTGDIGGAAVMQGTANAIGTIANFAAVNTLTVVDSQALALAGSVSTTNTGTVDISTLTGGLTQAANATLVTGTLTSRRNIAGAALLQGTANAIGTIANLAAVNALTVVNNQALALAGSVSATASGTVDITTRSGGLTQLNTGTLVAGTFTSTGGFASSVLLAGTANAVGSIGSVAVAGANGAFVLNDATDLTLRNTLSAHQIVVTDAARTIAMAPGARIATDGSARPNGAVQIANLPFATPGSPGSQGGAYFSSATFLQNGALTLANLSGASNVLRIDTTASTQFDTGSGLNGPNTWLVLGLNNGGTGSGAISVQALDVAYSTLGSANLTGSVNGQTGVGAAGAGHIEPAANAQYKMNACAISAVNCVIVTNGSSLRFALPDFVEPTFIVPQQPEDQDFLPLATSDRDY